MACLSYTYSDICINATLQTKHHSYGSFGGVGGVMDSTTSFCSLFHSFTISYLATVKTDTGMRIVCMNIAGGNTGAVAH